ncbi:TauD/TfdA family dioxygenase [Moritella sp. F3]|uniref:TauD/TfdA dioxygenase family protein n=1 Tax=Moritella sp. F3 TaxID=2718882 RepID=UPI0018E1D0F3|nr:TauD/TfdA family dioxygenase [Moritella sp. F3]GIC76273.1 taurine dioxygenase [Moritella sp. F1]GIC82939.1 taurine dioxygenase [Moritella sp. F3]
MHIELLTPHIGALIHNVDLVNCDDTEFAAVYKAWFTHQVIFFRDQKFSPQQHLKIAARFGELEPTHPFFPHVEEAPQVSIIETVKGKPPLESFWHTDLTWRQQPSIASLLHAQHVPHCGGDTLWTSMTAVFNALPEQDKNLLRQLSAMHALFAFDGIESSEITEDWQKDVIAVSAKNPPVAHPVITRNPDTGEEILFINEQFTRYIIGMDREDSNVLLAKLFTMARQPEYQVRFKWQANSLAIWDNRSTQHYAVIDYADNPRKLHRVTVV